MTEGSRRLDEMDERELVSAIDAATALLIYGKGYSLNGVPESIHRRIDDSGQVIEGVSGADRDGGLPRPSAGVAPRYDVFVDCHYVPPSDFTGTDRPGEAGC